MKLFARLRRHSETYRSAKISSPMCPRKKPPENPTSCGTEKTPSRLHANHMPDPNSQPLGVAIRASISFAKCTFRGASAALRGYRPSATSTALSQREIRNWLTVPAKNPTPKPKTRGTSSNGLTMQLNGARSPRRLVMALDHNCLTSMFNRSCPRIRSDDS